MNHATADITLMPDRHCKLGRRLSQAHSADVLADIYQDDVNISVWQRSLSSELRSAARTLLASNTVFRIATSTTPDNTFDSLYESLGASAAAQVISQDVADIVAMFCYLFELERVGLRLTSLEKAMCPKFHVDRVPCRLVSTYQGIATQWLPHHHVDRRKMGTGSGGLADKDSGLYQSQDHIQQLNAGDVAMLKGESWLGNEGAGLVHRSPSLQAGERRLLLTLDFN